MGRLLSFLNNESSADSYCYIKKKYTVIIQFLPACWRWQTWQFSASLFLSQASTSHTDFIRNNSWGQSSTNTLPSCWSTRVSCWCTLTSVSQYLSFLLDIQYLLYSRTNHSTLNCHLRFPASLRLGSFTPGIGIFFFGPKYLCSTASPGGSLSFHLVLRIFCVSFVSVWKK